MEYFPDRLTQAESDELIARIEAGFATRGYGLWALALTSREGATSFRVENSTSPWHEQLWLWTTSERTV